MSPRSVLAAFAVFLSSAAGVVAEEKLNPYPVGPGDWVWTYRCAKRPCSAAVAGISVPASAVEFTVVLTEMSVGSQKVPAYFWWVSKPAEASASGTSIVSAQASNATVVTIQGFVLTSVKQPH